MTAPDSGLTDLIAAHTRLGAQQVGRYLCLCGWVGDYHDHPAHVALVVEQHTNGWIAELAANIQHLSNNLDVARVGRATAEATIARVEKALAEGPLHRIDFPRSKDPYGIERQTIRAALEEEQQ